MGPVFLGSFTESCLSTASCTPRPCGSASKMVNSRWRCTLSSFWTYITCTPQETSLTSYYALLCVRSLKGIPGGMPMPGGPPIPGGIPKPGGPPMPGGGPIPGGMPIPGGRMPMGGGRIPIGGLMPIGGPMPGGGIDTPPRTLNVKAIAMHINFLVHIFHSATIKSDNIN